MIDAPLLKAASIVLRVSQVNGEVKDGYFFDYRHACFSAPP